MFLEVVDGYMYELPLSLEEAQRISASCCAQTSYRNTDDSLAKADDIFGKLVKADVLHASPFEHLAMPVAPYFEGMTLQGSINHPQLPETWEKGITHLRRDGRFGSGCLAGWIQYRQLMENNTCWNYDHETRMKLFEV
jgi:hypothetical protein